MTVLGLDAFTSLAGREHGLCVVSTVRADGTPQSSVVNAGVLGHPRTGQPVIGFAVDGDSFKLCVLRVRPALTVVARSGWEWAGVSGEAELVGPDDIASGIVADELRQLLRDVFVAAGGRHDDWDEYDRVMAAERRTVVLVRPRRIVGDVGVVGDGG
jgi:PPOX class probable F420-dependent enzyme